MPTEATVEDLSTAFASMSAAGGRKPGRRAFRDSLRVLDDCFCRSREKDDVILVGVPPTTSGRTVADKRLEVSLSCPTRRSSPWAA